MSKDINIGSKKRVIKGGNGNNPFPGLRPFEADESHLFFGRELHTDAIINNLKKSRFTAVIGASGTGKTSLIRCGLIPALKGGLLVNTSPDWKIIYTRPGSNPAERLIDSLYESCFKDSYPEKDSFITIFQTLLQRNSFGLIEILKQIKLSKNEKILLVIDQFEELFRIKEIEDEQDTDNEIEEYIEFLLQTINQTEIPVYTVITLRSEFLGDCSKFSELAGMINESNYLIPQMTREDYRKVISGPVIVSNAAIEESLVQEILNSIGNEDDQLSIFQHSLMRTWNHWQIKGQPSLAITLQDYEAIGKMGKALSIHADEAYDELTNEGKQICRVLFTSLTEGSNENIGIRHPATVESIASIAKAPITDVIEVIDKFRNKNRAFLTPIIEVAIDKDSVIDISHESLMRIWERLNGWIKEEAESVQLYQRLSESADLYQKGKTGLWRPPDLQLAVNWRNNFQPNLAWARRYNTAFERAMFFLNTSEKRFKAEEQNKIKLQQRVLKRVRQFAGILGIITIACFCLMFYANIQREEAQRQKTEAFKQRAEADHLRKIAEELKQLAFVQKDSAVSKRIIAEMEALEETRRRLELDLEKQLVVDSMAVVSAEKDIYYQSTLEERKQREQVEQTLAQTEQTVNAATEASQEEYRKRMISIAKSMALKSLTINNNINLKALLSYQAYLFMNQYSESTTNADLYQSMFDVFKNAYPERFKDFSGHVGSVFSLATIPGTNLFFSAGGDGKIIRWDMYNTSRTPSVFYNASDIIRAIAVSPDGRWLACGIGESGIQILDIKNKDNPPKILQGHSGWVWTLEFSPDGKYLYSASSDMTLRRWDMMSFQGEVFLNNDSKIRTLSMAPNGSKIACGTDNGSVFILTINSKEKTSLYNQSGNSINAIKYSMDGSLLAFGDKNGAIYLYNAASNQLAKKMTGHTSRIFNLAFQGNKYLASASADQSLKLWSLSNLNAPPVAIEGHNSWVLAVCFSTDGKYLLSSSQKGNSILIRPASVAAMTKDFCTIISANFTQDEWKTYVGSDIDYQKTCNK